MVPGARELEKLKSHGFFECGSKKPSEFTAREIHQEIPQGGASPVMNELQAQ